MKTFNGCNILFSIMCGIIEFFVGNKWKSKRNIELNRNCNCGDELGDESCLVLQIEFFFHSAFIEQREFIETGVVMKDS